MDTPSPEAIRAALLAAAITNVDPSLKEYGPVELRRACQSFLRRLRTVAGITEGNRDEK